MALQAEIIPFTLRTGTGTQTINHVRYPSLTAKSVIFVGSQATGDYRYQCGFDDGTTHLGNAVAFNETFGVALSARGYTTQYSLISVHAQVFFGGVSTHLLGYVSALNVGSFDITLDNNGFGGSSWIAIVIGGDGVECQTGLYDISAGSGTQTVGFDPIALLTIGVPDAGGTGQVAGALASYGFATICDSDHQVGWGMSCEPSSAEYTSYQIEGNIQDNIPPTSPVTLSAEVTYASVSNGFSVSFSGTPNWNIGYLAIGGSAVSANLVQILQKTSTGAQNVTIDSTDPVIAFFSSTDKVATAGTGNVDANFSFGCYDGNSTMSQWLGVPNGTTSPYKRGRIASTTNAITLATATGVGTQTVNATATAALASTNIALNWTAADATQREVWALVLGQNLTGTTNNCGQNPQASITVIKNTTPIAGGETEFPFSTSGGLSPSTFTLMDGESQLFSGLSAGTYGVTEEAPDGWTVSYNVSDGSSHDSIALGTGEAVTVTVTNTFASETSIFRKYRRWALPYDGNKRIFIPRIEIIAQMGVGNSDDPVPVMYLRISPDGGQTWGPRRQMPLGASGETMVRAYLTRFCQGLRNPVAELWCDDDVFVAWVECVLPQDYSVGTS